MESIGIEELISFLEKNGISPNRPNNPEPVGFSRVINFKVYDTEYQIIWYVNQSTLKIGSGNRAAFAPFRHVYLDTTFPLIGGNRSIGFSYEKYEKKSIFDSEYPFGIIRIPLDIEQK